MLSESMNKALNEQVKWELYSGYLYLSMSAHLAGTGLPGFANWMRVQAQEELAHGIRFYDFILARGGKVTLHALDAPPRCWESPLALFQATLEHERHVTQRIHDLVGAAIAEQDHATRIFLDWFVTEQVEEEENAADLVNKLTLIGDRGAGLFMLDKELAGRVFTPPAA